MKSLKKGELLLSGKGRASIVPVIIQGGLDKRLQARQAGQR